MMTSSNRQLAAIMFSDIVGYTALMGSDEEKAMSVLRENRACHKSIIKKHHGKWLKEMGDGTLASFNTIVDSVNCASELIKSCNDHSINLRIGIHLGDVISEDHDIFGDGVNVAARLEPLAKPNQILVSESIHRNIKNKHGIKSTFIEEKQLKNVDEPIKVYQIEVDHDALDDSKPDRFPPRLKKITYGIVTLLVLLLIISFFFNSLKEGISTTSEPRNIYKSIVVLPFKDMSPEQDQGYLGDGIAEEINNRLTRINVLSVIGWNSSLQLKGKDTDYKTIRKMLDVDAILMGSVRKSGDQLRITARLINANNGFQFWSKRFDRTMKDIFLLQDELAQAIVKIVSPEQPAVGKGYSNSNEDIDVKAYELFLKGKYIHYSRLYSDDPMQDFSKAETFFLNALAINPDYGLAHAGLADLYNTITNLMNSQIINDKDTYGNDSERIKYLNLQRIHAVKAFQVNPNSDYVNMAKGWVHMAFSEYDSAYRYYVKAFKLNPNDVRNITAFAIFLQGRGLIEKALFLLDKAHQIDPMDMQILFVRSNSNRILGNYQSFIKDREDMIIIDPDMIDNYFWKSLALIQLGRIEDAQEVLNLCKEMNSDYNFEIWECMILAAKGDKENTLKCQKDYRWSWSHAWLGQREEYIQARLKSLKNRSNENRSVYLNLINTYKYDWIKDDSRIEEFLEQERIKYERIKAKYGNLDFLNL